MTLRDRIDRFFSRGKPPENPSSAADSASEFSQYYWISFGSAPIEAIEKDIRLGGVQDERIIRAALQVHPGNFRPWDRLPRPAVVAGIVEALQATAESRVLEIGTGTGYLTAMLAVLSKRVISFEIAPALALMARSSLDEQIGTGKVMLIEGDGSGGYREEAPYDCICIHASAPRVPPPLLAQFADGGRLFLGMGSGAQGELQLITRQGDVFLTKVLGKGGFAPLQGRYSEPPKQTID